MKVIKVSVLPYADFRTFLNAYAQQMKNRQPMWSLGAWSKHLGLSTTSSLTKVLRGERNPGPKMVERFIEYFSFSPEEERHFRELVGLKKFYRDPQLTALLSQNVAARKVNSPPIIISERTFSVLSDWQYFAIREMVNLKKFKECPEWIAKRLCYFIQPSEVKKAIEALLDSGLLVRNAEGKLIPGEGDIDTPSDVASEFTKRYHEQSLENAKLALRNVPPPGREFSSSVFVISESQLLAAKTMIREFRDKLMRAFEVQGGDEVYQVQISFFPLTKAEEGDVHESQLLH